MNHTNLSTKLAHLKDILHSYTKVIVAYSGGTDSTFLLKVALDTLGRENVLACIALSESFAQSEYQQALQLARQMQAETVTINPNEMQDPQYRANSAQRCFYCKQHLFAKMTELAQQRNIPTIISGDNADDPNDHRPGLAAAKNFHIASPLLEASLTKADIRTLSKQLQLPTWNKPAQPCLASRISYGLEISADRLRQVEQGEQFLRTLLPGQPLRMRHHDQLVRIEVPTEHIAKLTDEKLREKIVTFFKQLGFKYVTLDLQGFRSGSANEVL
ncbi:MAG: ATP-dependent sacrificial sulfur transferase LarE [Sedimentisphaerales bacterium]|nr:ATP-dependent sacrificial sulfur transferase LarE [Sedimentisphaerales bacterium]